ncbi:MAG: NAD(P)/FAD-dependent oxidoreductase [Chloroflexi bacterium]|nr:NAD(P)/FAD-dependent oxidoreductase [Chloroflexota bacterium]
MQASQVVVIGAGPAGLATALQLKRQGIEVLLLEGGRVGGLLHNANLVENYPGFPGGLPGPKLVALFAEQAHQVGVEITRETVATLHRETDYFHIETRDNSYLASIVVVATGTKPKTFTDIVIPENLLGQVFYEVYPLLGVEGKRIAIIGAGDAAFDYALNLSDKNEVLILNRGVDISCLPLLHERVQENPSIQYFELTRVLTLEETPQSMIRLLCEGSKGEISFEVNDMIGAIGRVPRLDFIADTLQKQISQLETDSLLHFVGDVKNGRYRQTAIAVGDGIRAAMKIEQRLKNLSSLEHTL